MCLLTYKAVAIAHLQELLIYRDAYWKIAGEQMGLGKSWKPDWNDVNHYKYIIVCRRNGIGKDSYTAKNAVLASPNEEMRDAFYGFD